MCLDSLQSSDECESGAEVVICLAVQGEVPDEPVEQVIRMGAQLLFFSSKASRIVSTALQADL